MNLLHLALAVVVGASNVSRPVSPGLAVIAKALPPSMAAAAMTHFASPSPDASALRAAVAQASHGDPAAAFELARAVATARAVAGPLSAEDAALADSLYAEARAQVSSDFQGRLDAIAAVMGQAKTAPEALAAGAHALPAESRLQPSSSKHGLSDEELKAKIKPTVRGLNVAEFTGEEYKPEYEAKLKALGADMVTVDNPTSAQLKAMPEEKGYHFATKMLRWVTPIPGSFESYVAPAEERSGWPNSKVRAHIRKELKKSAGVDVSLKPLSKEEYEEWYPIWLKEVGGKPGGMHVWKKEFPSTLNNSSGDSATDPSKWFLLTFRVDGKLVGGSVMMVWKERGFVTIGAAAYDAAMKAKYQLSVRTFAEEVKLAERNGLSVASYGADMNGYGYDFSVGLNNYKISVGMTPYHEGSFRLVKLLDSAKLKAPELLNKDGKGEGFFLYGVKRDSALAREYERRLAETGKAPLAMDILGLLDFSDRVMKVADVSNPIHYTDHDLPARAPDGMDAPRKLPLP